MRLFDVITFGNLGFTRIEETQHELDDYTELSGLNHIQLMNIKGGWKVRGNYVSPLFF